MAAQNFSQSSGHKNMTLMKTLSAGAAAIALTTAFATVVSTPAMAQQTTSDIRGVITDTSGAPVSGASVTVIDTRTGTTRRTTTDSSGRFNAQNLSVSGSYTVTVTHPNYQGEAVEGVALSLGDTTFMSIDLAEGSASDEIIVVATRSNSAQVATGPSTTFDFNDLQNAPTINRDIKDVIRTDPRLFIDQSFGNGIQCAGASPRFNSLTVDGVRLNDNFGLNSNGFPTQNMPFSFDSIEQVAVELAPFDVEYGGFTACNVNAVTRSGSNEFHGSAFGDYTNDSLRGGSIEGSPLTKGDFREVRFGATLSGPIIKDRLFFFGSYEKTNGSDLFQRGPAEAGAIGVDGVSQAQLDRIFDIANTIYGFDPGILPASADVRDEKILAKIDWNITDNHRASFLYNYNSGFNFAGADRDPDEYEFFNHYYERGATLNAYSGQLFSNWTNNFSTEVRISYQEIDQRQDSVNGTDFGEVQIRTTNNGSDATVYLGADDSRHSNDLNYSTLFLKFKADYSVGSHLFSAGFERETIDIFNLFVQETEGEYRFSSIDDFELGLPNRITYENATGTNNPLDAAANFKYSTNTLYLQDEFSIPEQGLTITAGLRYDFYTSGDRPALNPDFVTRNGFDNTSNLDGKSLLQPRVALAYEATDRLSLRAGAGIFSGGNPNVWISNNYSNNGIIQLENRNGVCQSAGLFDPSCTFVADEGGSGRPIYGVPEDLFDDVANGIGRTGGVNALDPNFKIPSQWKASAGATYFFDMASIGGSYRLNLDYIYTRDRDAATVINAGNVETGTAPDGRPTFSNTTSDDFILTNNEGGRSHIISAALSGDYDSGFRWGLGYAYTDSKDRNPMTSSVAFSNFVNLATSNANNPNLATSNNEVPHRFTVTTGYEHEFFGDLKTKLNLFGTVSQSRPFSFTFFDPFGSEFGNDPDFFSSRALLYVPTGPSDPLVMFDPGFDQTAFFAFVDESGLSEYAGGIAPRNAFQSSWFSQWDVRIEQELPGVRKGHRAAAFVVIENLGNLIDDDWGVINQAGFPGTEDIVELGGITGGQFEFDRFITPTGETPVTSASVWEIRFGVRYEF